MTSPTKIEFNPDLPVPWDEMKRDVSAPRVYCTKVLRDGTVEAYSRGYHYLGNLTSAGALHLSLVARVMENWRDWDGGRDKVPGTAMWWNSIVSSNKQYGGR